MPFPTLKDKTALITGAARGIGAEIARELSARGAKVIINYHRSGSAAESLVTEIKERGGEAVAIQADVSNPEEIKILFGKALECIFPKRQFDIVISNSGIEHFAPIGDVNPAEYDAVFNLNTRAQFFIAQSASRHLVDHGRLILTGSISSSIPLAAHAIYAGSKCAIEAFARCMAMEFAPRQITVNCVSAGGIRSDMSAHHAWRYMGGKEKWTIEDVERVVSATSPRGRMGVPGDVSAVVAFLVSEEGCWVSGQNIVVSGGGR